MENLVKLPEEVIGKNICTPNIKNAFFFPELWTANEIDNWGVND